MNNKTQQQLKALAEYEAQNTACRGQYNIEQKPNKGTQNYRTPYWLYRQLDGKFGPFSLDAAADKQNHLCDHYYTANDNGLLKPWRPVTFCNPPYARVCDWIAKAAMETTKNHCPSILIVPAGACQNWFHDIVKKNAVVYLHRGRVNFNNPDGTPTKASRIDTMILHFKPGLNHKDFDVRPIAFDYNRQLF